jgi:hypothetical protein
MAKSVTEPQILLSDLWHQKSGNPRHNLFIFLVCSFFSRSLADTIWHDELMGSHGSKKGEQPIKVGLSWANRWWLWSLNLTPTGSWRNLKNPLPSPAEQLSGASWSCRPSQQLWTSPPGCVGVMSHLSWSTHGIRGMVRPIMWNLAESLFMDWWPSPFMGKQRLYHGTHRISQINLPWWNFSIWMGLNSLKKGKCPWIVIH